MRKEVVLLTGAGGQIGSVLREKLITLNGELNVIATDIRPIPGYEILDVLDFEAMEKMVHDFQVTQVYHLAAILSAKGEQNPLRTWDINMRGLFNVLELARKNEGLKLFYPSSIAVFGPDAPKLMTPQDTTINPTTVYGISKRAGEHWCAYYNRRYGTDVRSLRYPGLIGYRSMPGGGTTDYAVDIFHEALASEKFTAFLREDARLPMMLMDDAIRGTIELMNIEQNKLGSYVPFNFSALSFTPKELAHEIKQVLPGFDMAYAPDHRQAIADSWPGSIDDSVARKIWNWSHEFDLAATVEIMIKELQKRLTP